MAGKREVKVVISGDSSGAQSAATKSASAFDKTGTAGERLSSRMGATFGKLGNAIGGEFGDVLSRVGDGLDNLGEKGTSLGKKFEVGGAALVGVGAVLVGIGDKEKAASQQLNQAITNTGNSTDDFSKQIDSAVKSNEKYAISASTTKDALTILTNATHDPAKALAALGEADDLAAAKHEALGTAATAVAKVLGGTGAKTLSQYGIQVKTNADGTKDYASANEQLAAILKGQASAASDTFTGKLKAIKTEVSDQVAIFGQKYGPAITGIGTALTAAGGVMQIYAARQARVAAADAQEALSTQGLASSVEASAVTQIGALGSVDAAAVSTSETAVTSDQAAEASTGELASAVQASAAAQLTAFSSVAAGASALATEVIAKDEAMIAANEQAAASSRNSAGTGLLAGSGVSSLALRGSIAGTVALAVKEGFDQGMSRLDKDGGTQKTIADILGGLGGDSQKGTPGWAKEVGSWGKALSNPLSTVQKLGGAVESLFGSHKKNKKATDDDKASTTELAAEQQTAADKTKILNKETTDLTTALQNLGTAQIGDLQSQDSFLNSLDALTQSVADNGKSLDVNSTKGRANRDAFLSAGSAALGYAQAQQKNGVPIATVTKNLEANVLQLERTADKAGFSKTQVQALVTQMGLTPKQISTLFSAITGPATKALNNYVEKLTSINGTTVQTFVEVSAVGKAADFGVQGGTHGGPTARRDAVGTSFSPGGLTLLGDKGGAGELVDLPGGSKVYTGSQSDAMLAAASGGAARDSGSSTPIIVQLVLDGNVIHQSLLKVRRGKGGVGLQLG